jgi:hypothetical protein
MLRYPITRDWFEINLGRNGTYMSSKEHPNDYRERGLETLDNFADELDAIIRIDKGPYIAGGGPYLNNRI